jgi:hypothetical protein
MRYNEIIEQELDEISRIPSDHHGQEATNQGIRFAVRTKRQLLANVGDVRITWGYTSSAKSTLDALFVRDDVARGYAILQKDTRGKVQGWFVTEIGLHPSIQGRGIGAKFYDLLLDKGMTLFSGLHQTPDGEKMWQRLMKKSDIEVFVADDDGPVEIDPKEAWGHPDYILCAYKP